jgi:pimeloyl-ACP methyl ester carboxylesterase
VLTSARAALAAFAGALSLAAAIAPAARAQTYIVAPPPAAVIKDTANNGLYYEITGTGQNYVILIHGFSVDDRMWDEQAVVLAPYFRVLRYDLPSHGKSSSLAARTPGWLALAQLMDQLQIQKASIVGMSAGATIAADFALVHPERVSRLVLVSPSIDGYVPKQSMAWFGPIAAQARAGHPDSAAALFASSAFMQTWGLNDAEKVRSMVMANARVWADTVAPRPPLTPPAFGRLGQIQSAPLVIVGANDSPDVRAVADTIIASIPGSKLVVIQNAGHFVNLDHPGRFDEALVNWLLGVP